MKTIFSSRKYHSVARVSIFLITVALIAGMVGCTVEVTGLPVIKNFTADPESISAGESLTLSWDVDGATAVIINPDIGPDIGTVALTGTRTVSPTATTTYTLEASNEEGSSTATVQVTVSAPPLPDLTITTGNPTVTPSTADPGGTVSLSAWTVKNQGNADSGPFDNGFYLSTDSVITASDTYLTGNSNSNLAPGGQFDWDGPTLTIPSGTPSGNYYIGILVDQTNAVSESDEDNNYVASQVTVSAPSLPDLTITTGNPTVMPSTAAPGETVSLSAWTVKNQGNADSGPFSNGFYLSTDSIITASDTYLTGNSNSNLAPGGQFDWSGPTLTIPSGTSLGNYYIGILVDRTNEVSESDEDNNYVASPITVSAPSFAVTKVQAWGASASGTRTCPFTISYTFAITTNGAGTVGFDFERSDGYLSAAFTLSFTGAGTQTVSYTWTVGASGTYAVRCCTIMPNHMSSSYVPVTVTCSYPNPDLTIITGSPVVTPSWVAPGGTVSLSAWTVKNQGNADSGSFYNGFYLSTDSVITASDTYLTRNGNNNLAPGGQYNWGGPTLTIPIETLPGNYYIGILVDYTNAVSESNENNNYVSSPITVGIP